MPARSDIIAAVVAALGHVPGIAAITKYRSTPPAVMPCINIVVSEDLRSDSNQQFATYLEPMDPRTMEVRLELVLESSDEASAWALADSLLLDLETHTIGAGVGAEHLRGLVESGTALDYTWEGSTYELDGSADRIVMQVDVSLQVLYLPPALTDGGPSGGRGDWPDVPIDPMGPPET
jgi:hypothetical protein